LDGAALWGDALRAEDPRDPFSRSPPEVEPSRNDSLKEDLKYWEKKVRAEIVEGTVSMGLARGTPCPARPARLTPGLKYAPKFVR